MNTCTKCKKEKPRTEFNFKKKSLDLRHHQCKACTRLMVKRHFTENRGYYLRKTKIRNQFLRAELNTYIRDYLQKHPCVDCGESDLAVLEFDHTGKELKLMAVSTMMRLQYPLPKITSEINKCEVRCANCHRRKTAKDFNWLKAKNAPVAQRIEHQTSNL